MKNTVFILLTILLYVSDITGQALPPHNVTLHVGASNLQSVPLSRTYGMTYSHHLKAGIYLAANWTHAQGRRSLESKIGFIPPIDDEQSARLLFGENLTSDIIQSTILKLGLSKSIQLGQKFFFTGTVAIARSTVRHESIGGIPDDLSILVHLDQLFPTYESYKTLGASTSLDALYFIQDHMALSFGLDYVSSPRMYTIRLGASTWF